MSCKAVFLWLGSKFDPWFIPPLLAFGQHLPVLHPCHWRLLTFISLPTTWAIQLGFFHEHLLVSLCAWWSILPNLLVAHPDDALVAQMGKISVKQTGAGVAHKHYTTLQFISASLRGTHWAKFAFCCKVGKFSFALVKVSDWVIVARKRRTKGQFLHLIVVMDKHASTCTKPHTHNQPLHCSLVATMAIIYAWVS